MKIKATSLKIFLIASFIMLSGKISQAQTYNYYIANDHLVSTTVYEFSVFIQNTSGVDFSLRTVQHCFTFNSAFINGATVTPTFVAASSQLNSYSSINIVWSATAPGFTTTANGGVSCSNGTIIPASGTPVRVATFRLTATAGAFGCAPANPSMMLTGEVVSGLTFRMAITRWVDNANGICSPANPDPSSNTTITASGTFTRFSTQSQYSQVNNMRPSIATDPAAASTCSGGNATFTVTATGNGTANTLSYQWFDNGVPIPAGAPFSGETSPTLLISPVPFSLNGHTYSCEVLECTPSLTDTSLTALLTVNNTDDGNACTTDACDPASGTITHTPIVGINDNNACTTDACDPATGTISHTAVSVDDQNPCTDDACDPSTGNISHTPVNVDDNNVCTTDACDPATGIISHTNISVDDNNVCTTDACDPVTGISHTPTSITDNDVCTTDACDPVTGISHTPISITDNDVCTTDACDPVTGVSHTPISVDDGNACTTDGCNSVNGPFHNPVSVDDGNACTTDACNTSTGAITHTAVSVDDNNACTTDACNTLTGAISHTAVNFDDNNACTVDACDPISGVSHTPISTDDGNACTTDGCNTSTGVFHTPVVVDDGNACTTDACNTSSGTITHTAVNIDDNNACTTDACNTSSGAISHTAVSTNDGNACTVDACDPVSGVSHTPVNTDDGNACTTDACNTLTGAITHTGISIDDNNACTTDACNTANGTVTHTAVNTDDGNACTTDGCNTSSGVFHTPVVITDNDVCTTDACNTLSGAITHTPVNTDDNNACTTDGCNSVTGVFHNTINTNDNNACTTDGCNTLTGVFHNPVNTNDNNACTTDACNTTTGAITHTPVSVDDFDPCTTDACNTSTGAITHNPVNTDDGNACTTDGCNSSQGVFHTPVNIDDNNVCTTDACDPATGTITHNPVNISDNNPCTEDACDPITGITHPPKVTDDQNPCTTDACDPATGNITHTEFSATATSTPASCSGNDGTATAIPNGGTPLYNYSWSPGGQTTNPATGLGPNTYICFITDANGCSTSASTTVTSSGTNATPPTQIFGPAGACRGQCGVVYSIDPVAGATSYVWTLPTGATGHSTGTSITVCFNTHYNGGFICVAAVSPCGTSQTVCLNIPRITSAPGAPGPISGPTPLCPPANGNYSINPVANATSYVWSTTGGLIINSGQGSTTVNITAPSGFVSGTVKVFAKNCMGNSITRIMTVTGLPATPIWFHENAGDNDVNGVCAGTTHEYEIHLVPGATCYTWTAPPGAIINDRHGHIGNPLTLNSVNIDDVIITFPPGFVSGFVTVSACNSCGSSAVATLAIHSIPSTPIWKYTPPQFACAGHCFVFNIDNVQDATSWTYSAPPGCVITSPGAHHSGNPLTTTVSIATICFPANFVSGDITIYSTNACGNSVPLVYHIQSKPSQQGPISGPTPVCRISTRSYSVGAVSGASNYIWAVTGGAVILTGQGTTSVSVKFNAVVASSVTLSVRASNTCGSTTPSTMAIAVQQNCTPNAKIRSVDVTSEFSIYPNPTSGKATITFNADRDAKYAIKVVDMIGEVMINENISAVEGFNIKEINLENFSKGLYFISVQTEGDEAQTLRLVVE